MKNPAIFFGGSGGEIYTVFDQESESEVQNLPKPQENQNLEVLTSKVLTPNPPISPFKGVNRGVGKYRSSRFRS